jgi:hypothetical protein
MAVCAGRRNVSIAKSHRPNLYVCSIAEARIQLLGERFWGADRENSANEKFTVREFLLYYPPTGTVSQITVVSRLATDQPEFVILNPPGPG